MSIYRFIGPLVNLKVNFTVEIRLLCFQCSRTANIP